MQPGEVVGPGNQPEEPENQPVPDSRQPTAEVPDTGAPQEAAPAANWQYTEEEGTENTSNESPVQHDPVTWTASEYIAHDKTPAWYLALAGIVAVSAVGLYFITNDFVSSIVIVVIGIAFGSFAARKPQELTYMIDSSSLRVGNKVYPYASFKSFSIVQDNGVHSITFMPLHRFMPPLNIYYDPADEEKIADALSSFLPYEERNPDYVDRIMRKVKF